MNAANYITQDERLTKSNYDDWYPLIRHFLKSKGFLSYIEEDIVATTKQEVENGTKNNEDLNKVEKNDSCVMSFIFTSVSVEIRRKIKNKETAFEMMNKIKQLYDNQANKDVAYYLRKLNSLKARGLDDSLDIMSEMEEIFNFLDEKNYSLGSLEKTKYIYYALPNEVNSRLTLDPDIDFDDFIEEAAYKMR